MEKEKNVWHGILFLIVPSILFLLAFFLGLGPSKVIGAIPQNNAKIKELKKNLVIAGIAEREIETVFSQASIDRTIYLPKKKEFWLYEPESVGRGKDFIVQHRVLLFVIEGLFRVEKVAVVAIHAVETKFSDRLGDHRALDAMLTRYLYEEREKAEWMGKEIINWFIFCKKTGTSLFAPSSTWGATGPMQLMPSTALKYAMPAGPEPYKHFDRTHAFFSAANCLKQNGWKMNYSLRQPVSGKHLLYQIYNNDETYVHAVKKYAELISS